MSGIFPITLVGDLLPLNSQQHENAKDIIQHDFDSRRRVKNEKIASF